VFKTALFILDHFEEQLLKMKYEKLIIFINELPRSDFFYDNGIINKYKEKYKSYNITSELLTSLTQNHSQILRMSNEGKNVDIQAKQKHYIKESNKVTAVYI